MKATKYGELRKNLAFFACLISYSWLSGLLENTSTYGQIGDELANTTQFEAPLIDEYGFDDGYGDEFASKEPRLMTAAKIVEQLLRNDLLRTTIEQARIENRWLRLEYQEFKRLVFWLARDERRLRQAKTRLEKRRAQLRRFLNYGATSRGRSPLRTSLRQLDLAPAVANLLQSRLPPLEPIDFKPNSLAFAALRADGTLAEPPPILMCHTSGDPLTLVRHQFDEAWLHIALTLLSDQPISNAQLQRLRLALRGWQEVASRTCALIPPPQRYAARTYLRSLTSLTTLVANHESAGTLRFYLQQNGFGMPAGTVADLLRHLHQHNLSVRYGSRPHLVLAELGRDTLSGLDSAIAAVDRLVELHKSQNPSHNAVLRSEAESSLAGHDGGAPSF